MKSYKDYQRYKDLMINDKYVLRFWQMDSNSGNFVCSIEEDMLDEAIEAGKTSEKEKND